MLQFDYGDSVWEGGFCPICKIYLGGGDSVLVNKKEWGDSVGGWGGLGDFVLHS